LLEQKFDPVRIEKVVEACRSHSVKKVVPKTLEAKMLATADAMSHFYYGFYFKAFACLLPAFKSFPEGDGHRQAKTRKRLSEKNLFQRSKKENSASI